MIPPVLAQGVRNDRSCCFSFRKGRAALGSRGLAAAAVVPHDLRHTAAIGAVSAGANVKVLQNMLGHASAAMTLDIYSDLFDEDLEAIGVALDQARTRALVGK